eukprot:CAMPEP_0181099892 /NCGR_PEP_ID=MMETSP1071-20121207/12900_1 /TAXON_ID=35127 /ORGANISM="Thalassiosira sp., Strain NH16" /LENGTH=210 /DNA_ID=CAMNT_0023182581 /DNA_START=93 /DNA_END=726 /DNA_ORIENTATION=+
MKLLSTLIKCAPFATISFADGKRFTGRSSYRTEEHTERHLDGTELSMPGPMKMKESPGDNAGIAKLLDDKGVNEEEISGFLMALDISGAKMSSSPASVVCSIILDEILDFFLFSREVEDAIKSSFATRRRKPPAPPPPAPPPPPRPQLIYVDVCARQESKGVTFVPALLTVRETVREINPQLAIVSPKALLNANMTAWGSHVSNSKIKWC